MKYEEFNEYKIIVDEDNPFSTLYELETGGSVTRSDDEWTVVNDQTYEYTTSSVISSFELFSDNCDLLGNGQTAA